MFDKFTSNQGLESTSSSSSSSARLDDDYNRGDYMTNHHHDGYSNHVMSINHRHPSYSYNSLQRYNHQSYNSHQSQATPQPQYQQKPSSTSLSLNEHRPQLQQLISTQEPKTLHQLVSCSSSLSTTPSSSGSTNNTIKTSIQNVVTSSDSTATTTTTNANSKHPRSTFPFGKCKVCNDEASGVHYGVATCEGCKGFFKRCILRKEKYRCFFGSTCPVMPDNRNKCKACRFRRCLDAGMSMDGIKMGRIPKVERERAMLNEKRKKNGMDCIDSSIRNEPNESASEIQASGNSNIEQSNGQLSRSSFSDSQSDTQSFVPNEAQVEYLQNLTVQKTNSNVIISKRLSRSLNAMSLVEKSRCLYDAANADTRLLQQRASNLLKFGIKQFVGHDATVYDVWEGLVNSTAQCVKKMIGYTKELPGFADASPQDFGAIINNRLFEFYLLHNAPLIIDGEAYWMLPNDIQYSRKWMVQIVGKELADSIVSFGHEFNKIELTQNEFALLIPFVLTINDYNNFNEIHHLRSLHDMYSQALIHEMGLNKRTILFIEKLTKILELFPKLNKLYIDNVRSLKPLTK